MPSFRRSLSQNGALWLIGLIMVLLTGVFAYAYSSFRREAARQLLDRDRQLAVLSASRLQAELGEFADLLTALARTREMSGGAITEQLAALEEAAPRLDVFDGGVALLDDRGIVRGTLPEQPDLVAQDWSGQYAVERVLSGTDTWTSDAMSEGPDGPLVVSVVVPVLGDRGEFAGALAGRFNIGETKLSAFYGGILRLRLGQRGEPLVIDGHGRIIFASDPTRVGQLLSSAELPLIRDRHAATAELLRDASGKDVVAARAPVPGTNWTLATVADWREVTRETSRYRNLLFIAFAAALLLPPLGLVAIRRQRRFRFLELRRPEQDESWARAVQDQLHPKQLPVLPGWKLAAQAVPGKRDEHEFFDAAILPDGRMLLCVGAVAGTGLPAALAIASTRTLLRACGQRLHTPTDSLQQCNTSLCMQLDPPMRVRLIYGILEPRTGWLDFACAGASPLYERNGFIVPRPTVVGEEMGVNAEARIDSGRIHVEEGNLLILMGPAMTEARDADGRTFLEQPLGDVLNHELGGPYDLTDKVQRAFRAFNAGSSLFEPDSTIVVLERLRRLS